MNEERRVKSLADLHKIIPGSSPAAAAEKKNRNALQALITLHVLFEKAGRKGSGVTLVRGFHHSGDDLLRIARELKALCGAGGTVKDGAIEIQGDHRPRIAAQLEAMGFKVKLRK